MTSSLLVFLIGALWAVDLSNAHVSLSYREQKNLLNLHNTARAMEPATNMKTMKWNRGLAREAQKWTDRCVFDHQKNQEWGENLAAGYYREGDNVTALIEKLFNMWMDEKKYNRRGTFEECCGMSGFNCCHYTQVIWAISKKVGCGLTYCPNLGGSMYRAQKQLYLACYYLPRGNTPTIDSSHKYDWRPYKT